MKREQSYIKNYRLFEGTGYKPPSKKAYYVLRLILSYGGVTSLSYLTQYLHSKKEVRETIKELQELNIVKRNAGYVRIHGIPKNTRSEYKKKKYVFCNVWFRLLTTGLVTRKDILQIAQTNGVEPKDVFFSLSNTPVVQKDVTYFIPKGGM